MLTNRQIKLLNAIINEYLSNAEPVGSSLIVKRYKMDCSAATVRNEMAKLIELGFLDMLHTSSGRVPTPLAYRFFLSELMDEEDVPILKEVAIKQKLWPVRYHAEKLLKESTQSLSDITQELSFATTDDGYLTYSGAVNALDYPDFWGEDVVRTVLTVVDRYEILEQILNKASHESDVSVLIGDEIGFQDMVECAVVFSPYSAGTKSGFIGVIGPSRLDYSSVVPSTRYVRNLIQELGASI